MDEVDKTGNEASQLTAITTRTTDKHGHEMLINTTSGYEQKVFSSKTDWRTRAISSTHLHLRTAQIFVTNDDVEEEAFTYVMPKNLLKKFITISDLRTQIAGFLYGYSPSQNHEVKEIRCIIMPPQQGSNIISYLPTSPIDHKNNPFLQDMEPLGWIHTQPHEMPGLEPQDVVETSRHISENSDWVQDRAILITAAFTPGSCSLTSYRLNSKGIDWGKSNKDNLGRGPQKDFGPQLYDKVQMLLSDRFHGFFMVPDNGSWNMNFMGPKWSDKMQYGIKLGNPLPFYHEVHRPTHFLKFADMDQEEDELEEIDLENFLE